jgi:hypothetical protein
MKLNISFDGIDEKADALQERFRNAWLSVEEPEKNGFLRFYPTRSLSDYGNPSFDRNRSWWDQAERVFNASDVVFPASIIAFKAQILETANLYGQTLDQLRSTDQAIRESWGDLVELGRKARRERRRTRTLLKDDFDGNLSEVNKLVPPLKELSKKTPPAPTTPT